MADLFHKGGQWRSLEGRLQARFPHPEKDRNAKRFETITFDEVYEKGLKVMDMTAITLCNENKLPIVVFDMNKKGNLHRLISGEDVGTLVNA